MKNLSDTLQELLDKQLADEGYDVDLVPIPNRGDRMVRIRTLEEALDDFDSEQMVGYLVQVRPKRSGTGAATTPALHAGTATEAGPDSIFSAELEDSDFEGKSIFSRLAEETLAGAQSGSAAVAAGAASAAPGMYLNGGKLNVPFLLQNAELLYASGEYALARNIFQAVVQSGEHAASAHHWVGRCFEAEGSLDEAQISYQESIAYQPSLDAFQNLSSLLIRRQRDLEAAGILERATLLRDLPSGTRFELFKSSGNCWLRAGKIDEAERAFKKALQIDPCSDTIQANLGALRLQTGNTAEARRHFQDALVANPENEKALSGMGSCHFADGEKRQAHDCFARALEINLNNPTAVYYLVKCAYEIKSYATAARILEDYIEISPVNANLLYSLAGLQFHLGRVEEARATAERILGMQSAHVGANDLLKMIDRLA